MASTTRLPLIGFAAAVLALIGLAAPAHAEWRRAESPRFIVYSQGREGELRAYVQKLETFDRILRDRLGLPLDELPDRKLPIYLVDGRAGLTRVLPRAGSGVAGVYLPTGEDIFAIALRDGGDEVILHEYAHHFMFQYRSSLYPGWLQEGLAEYFGATDIRDHRVIVGGYSQMRVDWLQTAEWLPIENLLANEERRAGGDGGTFYPVAWLLTHWLMSDGQRQAQLQAYLDDIAQGGDPVDAMTRATGLTPLELRGELRRYFDGRIRMTRYEGRFPQAEVAVAVLPASADDLLLIGQRLKVGVSGDDQRAATAAEVRRLAALHPDDPFAQLQLGHAELHFGDPAAGEAVLTRLLQTEPENIEALQLMASRYLKLATERPEDRDALLGQARAYLGRAYRADEANYVTFILLGQSREGAAGYPTENDLATWALAYQVAPQLSATALGYARALMSSGDHAAAVTILTPRANAPHGGRTAETARILLDRALAGQPPLTDAEIAAQTETPPPA